MSETDPREEGLRRQLDGLGDQRRAGWKVGLTSGSARDSMGKGFRPFGFILEDRVFPSGATLNHAELAPIGVENEMCFRFGRDVLPGSSIADVRDAVSGVAPAFEINQRRQPRDAPVVDRLADNLSQWGVVIGSFLIDWADIDFDQVAVDLYHNDELVETVRAQGHIDDHFASLAALSGSLAKFDRQISAGDIVITGSYTRQTVLGPGTWRGNFGAAVGEVEVSWT